MSRPHPIDRTIERGGSPKRRLSRFGTAEHSRPKVAFVEGNRPQFSDETAVLLRSRLASATFVLSILLAVAFVANLFSSYAPLVGVRLAILTAFVGGFTLLQGKRTLGLFQLRSIEALLFGALVVQVLLMMGTRLLAFSNADDTVSVVATKHAYLSAWAILILTYGMLMPNTWQRALAVLLPTACLPYVLLLWLSAQHPAMETAFRADKLSMYLPAPIVAAFVATFGTHVITTIRREAFKARQLGQYILKEKLGSGGMGDVYRAEHQLLKRPCAIKLIKPSKATDAQALARFEREVQATAKLTHWNTVEIFDYGHAKDGTFYYVMELLPGMSLEELVRLHGPLPPERAVHFLRQTCSALREAHAKGLIHRDVKPANIIAAERGGVYDVAKLLDFGLVREQSGPTAPSGGFSGSPYYMCPEQITAYDQLNPRSDIYSLGAVAYFLVTGQPPFEADTILGVIEAHSAKPARPPSELNPTIPADLERVILRCLAKVPLDRYPDMETLEKAFGTCACANQWTDEQAIEWWEQAKRKRLAATPPN